ncbi:hypothetical protein NE865_04747 [Phthorimaea operculella]|nr:hypothetical protein NE865_04747 [Phthorimaea operculella]
MSSVEEGYAVAPWVGPASCKNVLSVVVLGPNADIIGKLAAALTEVHAKGNFRWKLITLRSYSLEEVVRQSDLTGPVAIDFVIIGIDSKTLQANSGLPWIEKTVSQVHPDLRSRRVVLVNTSYQQCSFSVPTEELLAIQSELKLDMLHANVNNKSDVECVARRLLRYMEVSLGTRTGMPNLNV